jgi:hypothetical protein
MPAADSVRQVRALRRIRAISWPLLVLISIILGATVIVAALEFVVLLGFPRFGSMHNFVSFGAMGVGVAIGEMGLQRFPGYVLVDGLTTEQRLIVAALATACWACNILALLQLRGLFSLYSRGVIFDGSSSIRIKRFGLWLTITAIVANGSGRLFVRFLHAPLQGTANAALAVVLGAMIYVIGYVIELAREADVERKEFV